MHRNVIAAAVGLSLLGVTGRAQAQPDQWTRQVSNLLALDKYARRVFRNERLGIVYQRPELGLNMNFSVGGNVAEMPQWSRYLR